MIRTSFNHQIARLFPLLTGLAILAGLVASPRTAQAQLNVLSNPGGEAGSFSGWTTYNDVGYNYNTVTNVGGGAVIPPYAGNYCFFIFGDYNGSGTEYNGMYQFASAHAGEVFTADGWVYQLPTDSFSFNNGAAQPGDANNAFLEVTFQDIGGNTLARYRSESVTNGSPMGAWYDLQVTNALNVNTYATTGSVSTLVAPAGTVQVEYNLVFNMVNYAGGSAYWDNLSLLAYAPPGPYITNLAPANLILATNNSLTFTAVAQSGNITNIVVSVTTASGLSNPTTNTVSYTNSSAALSVSGLNTTTANVSYPLASNMIYTITVLAVDSNGGTAVANSSFDTLQPTLVWEAEDFNYNNGQFFNTPADGGTALYTNLVGVQGVDENWIGGFSSSQPHFYRPGDAVSIQAAGEIPRAKFINGLAAGNTNAIDEEVGYNQAGDWENYTRTFPAGNYNIYARMATEGSGTQISIGVVGGDPTSSSQTVTNLGVCNLTDNGWNNYLYCPLVDSFGNLVTVHLSGQETLRSTIAAGGDPNINFYMIVPATGSPYPALMSSFPTGSHPFEPTNKFTFVVGPANGSPISTNAIHLSLNGGDVTSQLAFGAGVSNQWIATVPVALNTIYSAVINVTNTTSLKSTFTLNFDTFSQTNFMWEAEDWDFQGAQFIDNPVPSYDPTIVNGGLVEANSYCGYPGENPGNSAISGVDYNCTAVSGETLAYRPLDVVGTQVASDYLRQKFIDAQNSLSDPNISDVNIGYWNGGFWLNYTRTYPTGNFYIYGRLAGGNGPFSGTTVAVVTSGAGTATQTTNVLGAFGDPNAAGWQTWHWVELLTASGTPAVATLNGVGTLQITSGGNVNANYYMLVPAPAPAAQVTLKVSLSGTQPAISFATQAAYNYTLLYKNNLTDATWTPVTSIVGDGTNKTLKDATTTGVAHRYYQVKAQ